MSETFDFMTAVKLAKDGKKLSRKKWFNKDIHKELKTQKRFIYLVPRNENHHWGHDELAIENNPHTDGQINKKEHTMWTHPWLEDYLADDWYEVD